MHIVNINLSVSNTYLVRDKKPTHIDVGILNKVHRIHTVVKQAGMDGKIILIPGHTLGPIPVLFSDQEAFQQ